MRMRTQPSPIPHSSQLSMLPAACMSCPCPTAGGHRIHHGGRQEEHTLEALVGILCQSLQWAAACMTCMAAPVGIQEQGGVRRER